MWPDAYWPSYWPTYWPAGAVAPPGTDRKIRRARRPPWKAAEPTVVERVPALLVMIQALKDAQEEQEEQRRLAREKERIWQEAVAEVDRLVDLEVQEAERRFARRERAMRNLALVGYEPPPPPKRRRLKWQVHQERAEHKESVRQKAADKVRRERDEAMRRLRRKRTAMRNLLIARLGKK